MHPVLPGLLNELYGVKVPDGDRNDLVAVFLTGVTGSTSRQTASPPKCYA